MHRDNLHKMHTHNINVHESSDEETSRWCSASGWGTVWPQCRPVREHSPRLTIIQMKQNNKRHAVYIHPSFYHEQFRREMPEQTRLLASVTVNVLWVTIHMSGQMTEMISVFSCFLQLSSPLSVLNRVWWTPSPRDRRVLWLTAHYLQPNTNNNLEWRVTFRNLNASLVPVQCVSKLL